MKFTSSEDIQAKLKLLMAANDLSYKDMAERINTTPQNIHSVLNKKKHISFDDVDMICKALDMYLSYDINIDTGDKAQTIEIKNTDDLVNNLHTIQANMSILQHEINYLSKKILDETKNS